MIASGTHKIKLVECPRDAMQGWKQWIPTQDKIEYINALLKVGFDTIDFGSFVNPKAIPQMADTKEVISQLKKEGTTKLLAIIANERGATDAVVYDAIDYLGFPFSISETFQQRNTNSSIVESLHRVAAIQKICLQHNKQLVVYISMGFGNPYGDPYTVSLVYDWINKLTGMGISIISLADTVGLATAEQVHLICNDLITALPEIEIGVHLHSSATNWEIKLKAAIEAGCTRFDGALGGIGGCPMANDELVGNMDSSKMIPFFQQRGYLTSLNSTALEECRRMAATIFV